MERKESQEFTDFTSVTAKMNVFLFFNITTEFSNESGIENCRFIN